MTQDSMLFLVSMQIYVHAYMYLCSCEPVWRTYKQKERKREEREFISKYFHFKTKYKLFKF